MRFNKKELAHFSSSGCDFEGRLNYRTAGGSFAQPVFKERWFKLKSNFLFYFRFNDFGSVDNKEPAGVYVLENFTVQKEDSREMPFAFSLIFKDDPEYKHLFSARSADLVTSWIKMISECSYEHLRSQLDTYQNILKSMNGIESLQLSPYVNKRLLVHSQSQKQPAQMRQRDKSPKLRPKTDSPSFKCHVPLFEQAPLRESSTNIFVPPPNATPVRPARASDSSRDSPSASPARVPIRKPPPPPQGPQDLIQF